MNINIIGFYMNKLLKNITENEENQQKQTAKDISKYIIILQSVYYTKGYWPGTSSFGNMYLYQMIGDTLRA